MTYHQKAAIIREEFSGLLAVATIIICLFGVWS